MRLVHPCVLFHSLPQYDAGISMLFTTYLHVLRNLLTYLNLRINLLTYLNLSNIHIQYIYIHIIHMIVNLSTPGHTHYNSIEIH